MDPTLQGVNPDDALILGFDFPSELKPGRRPLRLKYIKIKS